MSLIGQGGSGVPGGGLAAATEDVITTRLTPALAAAARARKAPSRAGMISVGGIFGARRRQGVKPREERSRSLPPPRPNLCRLVKSAGKKSQPIVRDRTCAAIVGARLPLLSERLRTVVLTCIAALEKLNNAPAADEARAAGHQALSASRSSSIPPFNLYIDKIEASLMQAKTSPNRRRSAKPPP